jgi:hypothetical protein
VVRVHHDRRRHDRAHDRAARRHLGDEVRIWYAVVKAGATVVFRTPYDAMRVMDMRGMEGDLYTQHDDGPRIYLGHRTIEGEWK